MKLTLQNAFSVKLRSDASTNSAVLKTVLNSHIIDGIKEVIDDHGNQWWQVEVRSSSSAPPLKGFILAQFLKEATAGDPPIPLDRKGFIRSLRFAAIIYGSNRDYLAVVAQIESSMQNIRGTSGSEVAIGPFQFTPTMWAELLASMADKELTNEAIARPSTQALVAAYHSGRNITAFLEKRGVLPTRIELYLTDAFGMDIADAVLNARDADAKKKLSELSLPAIKHFLPAKQATAIINKNEATVEDLLNNIEAQIQEATKAIAPDLKKDNADIPPPISSGEPPWLTVALKESGQKEIPGTGPGNSNKRIEEYHDSAGSPDPDDVPWCASFVSFCMANSDNPMIIENNLKSKLASDWMHWGEPIDNPPIGALCVMSPMVKGSSGHVGFFIKWDSKNVTLLGGNQGDSVCEKDFPVNKIRSFRWLNWKPSLPTSTTKDENVDVLARTLWGEARGEPTKQGREAVASVVLNRTKEPDRFGGTVKEVCKKRKQFSCWNSGDPNLPKLLKVTESDPVFAECMAIATTAVAALLADPTSGATHYHAKSITPAWAIGKIPCARIGSHLFYINIP